MKGSPPLRTHHVFAFLGGGDHEAFNERLGGGLAAAALAHMDDAGRRVGMGHDSVVHQVVHQQHGGLLNGFQGFEREQLRVARARAHQGDVAGSRGVETVFHGARCKLRCSCRMCATCSAIGAGTGLWPCNTD